jgi:hypothetical protein
MVAAPAPPGPAKRRGALIGAAAVVALALGAGVFLLLRDDGGSTTLGDESSRSVDATTAITVIATTTPSVAPTTISPTTIAPTTIAPTTVAPSTLPPVSDPEQMLTAMPSMYGVPADWVLSGDATSGHEPTTDDGLCNGPNNTSVALQYGSTAQVDGPTYDLPSGASFGIEGLSFASPADASGFLAALATQVSGCTTTPAITQLPESELEFFADPVDTTWQLDYYASAAAENAGLADEVLVVIDSIYYSTMIDAWGYSVTDTWQHRFERYGRHVIEYWTYGAHDFVGFNDGTPAWAYTPTPDDATAAAAAVRDHIRGRLLT